MKIFSTSQLSKPSAGATWVHIINETLPIRVSDEVSQPVYRLSTERVLRKVRIEPALLLVYYVVLARRRKRFTDRSR